jgi:hypothetical protein
MRWIERWLRWSLLGRSFLRMNREHRWSIALQMIMIAAVVILGIYQVRINDHLAETNRHLLELQTKPALMSQSAGSDLTIVNRSLFPVEIETVTLWGIDSVFAGQSVPPGSDIQFYRGDLERFFRRAPDSLQVIKTKCWVVLRSGGTRYRASFPFEFRDSYDVRVDSPNPVIERLSD